MKRFPVQALVLASLFGAGFILASRVVAVDISLNNRLSNSSSMSDYSPRLVLKEGPQLEMVFIGAYACAFSKSDSLAQAIGQAKRRLVDWADANQVTFKATGVALDPNPEIGTNYLEHFGKFDEVSAGSSWGNSFALREFDGEEGGLLRTPQVRIYQQELKAVPAEGEEARLVQLNRKLLAVLSGPGEIVKWAENLGVVDNGWVPK